MRWVCSMTFAVTDRRAGSERRESSIRRARNSEMSARSFLPRRGSIRRHYSDPSLGFTLHTCDAANVKSAMRCRRFPRDATAPPSHVDVRRQTSR
ncbi:unnamed protein product, partial [Iphiclides podalirius]